MDAYTYQYLSIVVFLCVAIAFPLAPLLIARVIAPRKPSAIKSATYECGPDRSVEVEPLSASGSTSSLRSLTEGGLWLDDALAVDWYDADDVRALRESDAQLAVVVTVTQGYYRTRF